MNVIKEYTTIDMFYFALTYFIFISIINQLCNAVLTS